MKNTAYKSALIILTLLLLIPIIQAVIYAQQSNIVTQTIFNQPYFYVDNNTSDVDSNADKGSHSNFTAQQTAPDLLNDTLTEINTGGVGSVTVDTITTQAADTSSFSFSHSCSGSDRLLVVSVHCDSGDKDVTLVSYAGSSLTHLLTAILSNEKPRVEVWYKLAPGLGENTVQVTLDSADKVTVGVISYNNVDQTTPIDGATSAEGVSETASVTVTSEADDLVQDVMASISDGVSTVGSDQTQRYNIEMGGSGASNHYGAASTESGVSSVLMTWSLTESKEWVVVGFNINSGGAEKYELDLEVQWTNIDFSEANEELCIYAGSVGDEDIRVDVWDGGSWTNLFTDLTNGWNNVTVSTYLLSSTFTIRFKGTIETGDTVQDSWNIDSTLLHVWS